MTDACEARAYLKLRFHCVGPCVRPALRGITLDRLDENIRSSLVLGFVGAGGIGFQLLAAINLFEYRGVRSLTS